MITEDAEDHEIFDINDFTTASDWERYIKRKEEIILNHKQLFHYLTDLLLELKK